MAAHTWLNYQYSMLALEAMWLRREGKETEADELLKKLEEFRGSIRSLKKKTPNKPELTEIRRKTLDKKRQTT